MKILISTFIIFLFAATSWATDLSTATLKQLVTERPDLIADIKAGKDKGSSTVSVIKDAQGRMSIWAEKRRDLDSNLISKRIDKYTYYKPRGIDTITMEVYDDKNLISKKIVKHYLDETQPDVEWILDQSIKPK